MMEHLDTLRDYGAGYDDVQEAVNELRGYIIALREQVAPETLLATVVRDIEQSMDRRVTPLGFLVDADPGDEG